jgi:hypothetical protein
MWDGRYSPAVALAKAGKSIIRYPPSLKLRRVKAGYFACIIFFVALSVAVSNL